MVGAIMSRATAPLQGDHKGCPYHAYEAAWQALSSIVGAMACPRPGVGGLRWDGALLGSLAPRDVPGIYASNSGDVERTRTSRATGARPGGWAGRGPAFMGGMGRVHASPTGRRISSP